MRVAPGGFTVVEGETARYSRKDGKGVKRDRERERERERERKRKKAGSWGHKQKSGERKGCNGDGVAK